MGFLGRMRLYYLNLDDFEPEQALVQCTVVEIKGIEAESLTSICYLQESIKQGKVREFVSRLETGASIWIIYDLAGQALGYGCTMQDSTYKPHYFELLPGDVHLFDFFVHEDHRGKGINRHLMNEVLRAQKTRGMTRAHIECAAWNTSQIRSLSLTKFRHFADVMKLGLGSRRVVVWI